MDKEVIRIIEQSNVMPDVINAIPPNVLHVDYPTGVAVNLGNELTPSQVRDVPFAVRWPTSGDRDALYTLCMLDPDSPSRRRPNYTEWIHWLVVNIPGNDISMGDVLSEYVGSIPEKDSGLHRYVIVVFKQPERFFPNEKRLTSRTDPDRQFFKLKKFAAKYRLTELIAANFFQSQWDESVPELREQLNGANGVSNGFYRK